MRQPQLRDQRLFDSSEAMGDTRTGRYIVTFAPEDWREGVDGLEKAGLRVANMADSTLGALRGDEAGDAELIVLPNLASGLLSGEERDLEILRRVVESDAGSAIISIEPERSFMISPVEEEEVTEEDKERSLSPALAPALEWGLVATRISQSTRTGRGIKVAILDTGVHLNHADLKSRLHTPNLASFVFNVASPQDGNGHGTHTTGLACGPLNPVTPPRYGVATEAEIFIGKVIPDLGIGATGEVASGIEWAISKGCPVILLALEMDVAFNQTFDSTFESWGRKAAQRNCLLIAAVGNGSNRPSVVSPVSSPANCPSIFGVGGVEPPHSLYKKSNGELSFPGAGTVNVLAPAAAIRSSDITSQGYRVRSGTSMAAALTAGIAALYAEIDATLRGVRLGVVLQHSAINIGIPPTDGGNGLVQAPL
jgi:subtilisin family serine protease